MASINLFKKPGLLFTSFILCILVVINFSGCSTTSRVHTQDVTSENGSSPEERCGIEILGIRLSAAGYMLDFRYRVLNPEKAAKLFGRKMEPYLVDQATGAKFSVPNSPKVGPLRTTTSPEAHRTYFIMFANPGRYVKKGNKVTVVIGDFKAKDLIVE